MNISFPGDDDPEIEWSNNGNGSDFSNGRDMNEWVHSIKPGPVEHSDLSRGHIELRGSLPF